MGSPGSRVLAGISAGMAEVFHPAAPVYVARAAPIVQMPVALLFTSSSVAP